MTARRATLKVTEADFVKAGGGYDYYYAGRLPAIRQALK